jgi:hypothetical protein
MRACIKPHIWSATPNNQQADHPPTSIKQIMIISNSSVHRPIDHPQANDGLLTTRPYRSTFKTDPNSSKVNPSQLVCLQSLFLLGNKSV